MAIFRAVDCLFILPVVLNGEIFATFVYDHRFYAVECSAGF